MSSGAGVVLSGRPNREPPSTVPSVIVIEPPHHRPPPQRNASEQASHRLRKPSTIFATKSAGSGREQVQQTLFLFDRPSSAPAQTSFSGLHPPEDHKAPALPLSCDRHQTARSKRPTFRGGADHSLPGNTAIGRATRPRGMWQRT